MPKNAITAAGLVKLKQELERLDTTERRKIAARLERAISFGDLSENAEYEEAKEAQSAMEQRVRELKHRLATAQLVEKDQASNLAQIGSAVQLELNGRVFNYTIVSPEEADPAGGLISSNSPLGQALLGQKKGAKVKVDLPAGAKVFTIKAIG